MSSSLDILKEAAMNFGSAVSAQKSGMECALTSYFLATLAENKESALRNLEDAAICFYEDHFDGAPT